MSVSASEVNAAPPASVESLNTESQTDKARRQNLLTSMHQQRSDSMVKVLNVASDGARSIDATTS